MKKQVFFLLPVLCTLFITFLHARIIHVPSDSSTIQGGINGAVNGDTVLVAPGTNYEHDVDFLGKAITVMSTDPADSAVVANTVVNGDSLGSVFIFRSGEDSTSILSGFTITGGLAEWGGGVFCSGASPTITNNMITGNSVYKEYHGGSWSGRGGGVYCGDSSSAIITYNTIVANMAEYSGGGIACGNGADVRITNNIIKENMVTDSGGGGIACISSAPRIINNLVVNNHVRMHGGGILFNNCPLGRIINTTIINNSSDYRTSGGFYCATSPVMTNCILWDNLPDEVDGNPVVTFSAVKGGWSGEGNTDENPIFIDPAGGLFYLAQDPCQPGITNPCVDEGDPSLPMVTGTTRTDGNQDSGRVDMGYHYPAGISGTVAPSARFTWTPLYPDPGVPVQFDASWSSDPDGGVISLYEWDWDNDGVYDESYAIPTVIHSWTEIDSYPVTLRVWDDEGDYDTQTESVRVYPNPIYVPDDYLTIQGAIDVAIDGDTIIVIPGTYYEHDLDFLGKAIMVRGTDPEDSSIVALTVVDASSLGRVFYFHSNEDSMSVLKGLTITGGLSNQGAGIYCYRASPKIENCIIRQNTATISGGGGISCFVSSAKIRNCSITGNLARDDFPGGGIACWHKSSSAESPVISNCRIRGNKALGGSGGGLYLDDNSTIVEHCTIIGDTALFGGGIETDSFKGEFKNCTIRENVATISVGGGVFCDTGTPLFTDCVVENNWAYGHGGGFYFHIPSPVLKGCLIADNIALDKGGGICGVGVGVKTIKLENCIITGNDANEGGGLSLDLYLEAQINNCTFSENTAHNVGGAIHIEDTTPMIVNSILWGNSPDEIFGTPLVTYSDVQGGWAGTGNINVDPLFRDPEFDDYYLMWTECADPTDSPCIDAGHPDSSDVLLDCFHGLGTAYCDMGAYGGRNGEPPTVIEKGKIKKSVFIPRTFNLYQNYPNPFNPSTTIKIDIPGVSGEEQHVEVTVYDLRGRRVKTLISSALESGSHKLHWDGRNDKGESVSSGIYLYSLRSSSQSITRRMTLLK